MSKKQNNDYQLTAVDGTEILKTTLQALREIGFKIGFRDAPTSDKRPPGIFIFVSGLHVTQNGIELLPAPAKPLVVDEVPKEPIPQKVE